MKKLKRFTAANLWLALMTVTVLFIFIPAQLSSEKQFDKIVPKWILNLFDNLIK